ncbi:MAG: carbon-nitrogen hydrolase family protein, partial [Anaerolineales bacterium]|nr:carbon-nitrogen hydrolase family protein [Anaerolineales bacterium]
MTQSNESESLKVGLAQIAPVWLNRKLTLTKILEYTNAAGESECNLIAFGEGLLPGYPFWIERTNGAEFNSPVQKEFHAHYMANAVQIEAGHLDELCKTAKQHNLAVMLGCIERPEDRGGHSLYASLVYIDPTGTIQSIHRKLMPTYEERLTWSPGDGHGLRVHRLGPFILGGLNCWENWMPLARAALYGQGEDLHVAVWPGGMRSTQDITRFVALEARSYVISVSGLMRSSDIPADTPHRSDIKASPSDIFANGGSCIAAPDGSWIVEPVVNEERLILATLNHKRVREERQNFDP